MVTFNYTEPLLILRRKGTNDDPYVELTDNLVISNGRAVLKEIPDKFQHVVIPGFAEINTGSPAKNEFLVTYSNGMIEFNVLDNDKAISATYRGRGYIMYPADRIYTHKQGQPNIVESLQDIINRGTDALIVVDTLGSKITETNTAIASANQATTNANTAKDAANTAATNANSAIGNTVYMGVWSNTITYKKNNSVLSGNTIYICILDAPVATVVTNTTYWTVGPSTQTAIDNANTATTSANNAATSATGASTSANNAATAANTAKTNADTATTNANTAKDAANTAATSANTATTNANNATTSANNAATSLSHKGVYSGGVTYNNRNIVTYSGSSYMCTQDNTTGFIPTDTSRWQPVGLKGDKGDIGNTGPVGPIGVNWKNAWSNTVAYNPNDGVSYNGSSYICTVASPIGTAPTDVTKWDVLVLKGADGAGTIATITSANGDIAIGGTASDPTLTLNSGTGANQIVKRGADGGFESTGVVLVTRNVAGTPAIDILNVSNSGGTNNPQVKFTVESSAQHLFEIWGKSGVGSVLSSLFAINMNTGNISIGTASTTNKLHIVGKTYINTGLAVNVGLVIQSVALQTGNSQEWQDDTGAIMAAIDKTGAFGRAGGTVAVSSVGNIVITPTTGNNPGLLTGTQVIVWDQGTRTNVQSARGRIDFLNAAGNAYSDIFVNSATVANTLTVSGTGTHTFNGTVKVSGAINGYSHDVSDTTSKAIIRHYRSGAARFDVFSEATTFDTLLRAVTGVAGSEVYTEAIRIINANGNVYFTKNVGFGTATPSQKIHVVGKGYFQGVNGITLDPDTGGAGTAIIAVDTSQNLQFQSGSSPIMTLLSGGNIGLSINTPTYGIHQIGGGHKLQALAIPSAPTVTVIGTAGTTSYTYYVVAEDRNGKKALVSIGTTVATGNTTLDATNFNRITWAAVAGAVKYYVLKTNTTTLLGNTTTLTMDDIGQATSAFTAPTRNATADMIIDGSITAATFNINSTLAATVNISPLTAGTIGMIIKGNSGQSERLAEFQDSNGTIGFYLNSSGQPNVPGTIWVDGISSWSGGTLTVDQVGSSVTPFRVRQSGANSTVPVFIVKLGSTPTATGHAQTWVDNTDAILAVMDKNGNIGLGITSPSDKLHIVGGTLNINGGRNWGNLSVAPTTPVAGDEYYNTTTNKKQLYNGTSWAEMDRRSRLRSLFI